MALEIKHLQTSCGDPKVVFEHSGNYMIDGDEFSRLRSENAELKQNLRDHCTTCHVKEQEDDVVADLKRKLESVQASMYCDVVDANMENRKLKRALWLVRADRADDRARIFYFCDMETELDIEGFSYDSQKKKGHKKLAARLWRIIWLKVERKCRSKAEEYK